VDWAVDAASNIRSSVMSVAVWVGGWKHPPQAAASRSAKAASAGVASDRPIAMLVRFMTLLPASVHAPLAASCIERAKGLTPRKALEIAVGRPPKDRLPDMARECGSIWLSPRPCTSRLAIGRTLSIRAAGFVVFTRSDNFWHIDVVACGPRKPCIAF